MLAPLIIMGAASLMKGAAEAKAAEGQKKRDGEARSYAAFLEKQPDGTTTVRREDGGPTFGLRANPGTPRIFVPAGVMTGPTAAQQATLAAPSAVPSAGIQAPGLQQPMTSDRRAKTKIEDGQAEMDAYLRALSERR